MPAQENNKEKISFSENPEPGDTASVVTGSEQPVTVTPGVNTGIQFQERGSDPVHDWMFLYFAAAVLIIGFGKRFYGKALFDPVSVFFGIKSEEQEKNDSSVFNRNIYAVLFIVAVSGIALFGYFTVVTYRDMTFNAWSSFGIFAVLGIGVAVAALLKLALYEIAALVFDVRKQASKILKLYFGYIISLGVFLLPLSLILAYSNIENTEVLLTAGGITAILLLIFKLIKIFFLYVFSYSFSAFYIILYLCTFEILPVLLAGTWLRTFV